MNDFDENGRFMTMMYVRDGAAIIRLHRCVHNTSITVLALREMPYAGHFMEWCKNLFDDSIYEKAET